MGSNRRINQTGKALKSNNTKAARFAAKPLQMGVKTRPPVKVVAPTPPEPKQAD